MAKLHLTDLSVKALKGSNRYVSYMDTKTKGFGLRVGLNSKTWIIIRGRDRERLTIGRYPELPLSEARGEARRLLAAPPEAQETKPVRLTFAEARPLYLEENFRGSTSTWPYQVGLMLKKHFKSLDHKQLAEITDADIKRALDKLADRPGEQLHAFRVARAFLKWCTRPPRRYLRHSPMEGYEAPSKQRKGTRILTDDELNLAAEFIGGWAAVHLAIGAETLPKAPDTVETVPGDRGYLGSDQIYAHWAAVQADSKDPEGIVATAKALALDTLGPRMAEVVELAMFGKGSGYVSDDMVRAAII